MNPKAGGPVEAALSGPGDKQEAQQHAGGEDIDYGHLKSAHRAPVEFATDEIDVVKLRHGSEHNHERKEELAGVPGKTRGYNPARNATGDEGQAE